MKKLSISMSKRKEITPKAVGMSKGSRTSKSPKDQARLREIESNRKFGQATRTHKACDLCRKQKTRCFKSSNDASSCLRCSFLNKKCSFETNQEENHDSIPTPSISAGTKEDSEKLDLIYQKVKEIYAHLKSASISKDIFDNKELFEGFDAVAGFGNLFPPTSNADLTSKLINDAVSGEVSGERNLEEEKSICYPSFPFKFSPLSLIQNQFEHSETSRPLNTLISLNPRSLNTSFENIYHVTGDIISIGMITMSKAKSLMDAFRMNYGRWVSFPVEIDTETLINQIRKRSPLLLTTCCCLSMRYMLTGGTLSREEVKSNRSLFKKLFQRLLQELNKSLLKNAAFRNSVDDGDFEFLQALVILSIYSNSLTSLVTSDILHESNTSVDLRNTCLDAWHLSSIALTTFISKSSFGLLLPGSERGSNFTSSTLYPNFNDIGYQKLTIMRIYNHLILVHLVNCMFSGRMCVIDEIRLNYCTTTLSLPDSTNFDGRMISEIGISLIAYNYVQISMNSPSRTTEECERSYKAVKEEVSIWYDQWEYLFQQPARQFVELNFHFCSIVIICTYSFQKLGITSNHVNYSNFLVTDSKFIYDILEKGDERTILTILWHSYNLVKFVNFVESNSYFAYLSDQIHFSTFFGAVVLINCISYMKNTNNYDLLKKDLKVDVTMVLNNLTHLIHRLDRIAQFKEDVAKKYSANLNSLLNETGFI